MLTNDQVLLLLHLLLFLPLLVLVVRHTHMTLPQSPSHRHIRTYWHGIFDLRWCPCRSWPFPPSSYSLLSTSLMSTSLMSTSLMSASFLLSSYVTSLLSTTSMNNIYSVCSNRIKANNNIWNKKRILFCQWLCWPKHDLLLLLLLPLLLGDGNKLE